MEIFDILNNEVLLEARDLMFRLVFNGKRKFRKILRTGPKFDRTTYLPVWPRLHRFKRLSRCPAPVSKMSRNFTLVKFSKLTPA